MALTLACHQCWAALLRGWDVSFWVVPKTGGVEVYVDTSDEPTASRQAALPSSPSGAPR